MAHDGSGMRNEEWVNVAILGSGFSHEFGGYLNIVLIFGLLKIVLSP